MNVLRFFRHPRFPFAARPAVAAATRKKKERNDLVDRLQYVALRIVSIALHCFPISTNLDTAAFVGDFIYMFYRRGRERAVGNLRRSFPEYTAGQCQAMARESMRQMVMLFTEVLFTTRLIHINTWARYVHLENFREVLEMLIRRDRGVILLTGHYGNWEILGYVLATLGFETTSIARPLDNPYVNHWLLGVREKQGQRIIDKTGATTEVAPLLASGGTVGFIADQNAGSKGVFVDFFGRKASTYKSIGLLAMEYEVPVVIGYARRIGRNFRFHVGVQDVIDPADWKQQNDPLRYITQRYSRGIEDFVRADPAQYLWIHRRWKTRPKGEAPEQFD
jgi:KDO2-lipid IV(A) lauroyltransferase